MYYMMRASAPSLHRESPDSLIHITTDSYYIYTTHIYTDLHYHPYTMGNSYFHDLYNH